MFNDLLYYYVMQDAFLTDNKFFPNEKRIICLDEATSVIYEYNYNEQENVVEFDVQIVHLGAIVKQFLFKKYFLLKEDSSFNDKFNYILSQFCRYDKGEYVHGYYIGMDNHSSENVSLEVERKIIEKVTPILLENYNMARTQNNEISL